jgi:uncharacterized protein YndB with AHSA1/START domain
VSVHAPRAVVFEALTSPQVLMRWFPTRAESDPRTGGKFKFYWDFAAAGQDGTQEGTYSDVVPNERISYKWQAGPAPLSTNVTIALREANGETSVHLVHSGWQESEEGNALRANHAGPWSFYLANLKSYLERGVDERTAKLGQKTM